jgi:hypothetical protein
MYRMRTITTYFLMLFFFKQQQTLGFLISHPLLIHYNAKSRLRFDVATYVTSNHNGDSKVSNVPISNLTTTTTTTTTKIEDLSSQRKFQRRKNEQTRRDDILCKVQDVRLLAVQQLDNAIINNKLQQQSLPIKLLTQEYCDYLIAECVAIDEWDSAYDVIEIIKDIPNLTYGRSSYKACIQACYYASNAPSCNKILLAMEHDQIEPDIDDIDLVVRTMCRSQSSNYTSSSNNNNNNNKQKLSFQKIQNENKQQKPTRQYNTANKWIEKALQIVNQHYNLPIAAYDCVLSCLLQ